MFGGAVYRRRIMLGVPGNRRDQHYGSLLVPSKKSADGQPGELDLQGCLESARVVRFELWKLDLSC